MVLIVLVVLDVGVVVVVPPTVVVVPDSFGPRWSRPRLPRGLAVRRFGCCWVVTKSGSVPETLLLTVVTVPSAAVVVKPSVASVAACFHRGACSVLASAPAGSAPECLV